jgi:hypothetical protein
MVIDSKENIKASGIMARWRAQKIYLSVVVAEFTIKGSIKIHKRIAQNGYLKRITINGIIKTSAIPKTTFWETINLASKYPKNIAITSGTNLGKLKYDASPWSVSFFSSSFRFEFILDIFKFEN